MWRNNHHVLIKKSTIVTILAIKVMFYNNLAVFVLRSEEKQNTYEIVLDMNVL